MNTPQVPNRWRVAGAGVAAVVLQLVVVSQVPPFSGSADIVPLAIMTSGLALGSLQGAVFGFSVGLGCDLLLVQPLGESALIGMAVGYGAGRVGELRPPTTKVALIPLGALAAFAATLGFGLLQVLLGGGASLSLVALRQLAFAVLWGGLLAVPVNSFIRWCIGVDRSGERGGQPRGRGYTTGGLSPLTPGRKR